MTPLDAATRTAVGESLQQLFAASASPREVVTAVSELGWDEIIQEDPAAASTMLFTAQGAALASTPLLDDILLAQLADVLPPADALRAVLIPSGPDGLREPGPTVAGLLLGSLEGVAEVVVPVSTAGGVAIHVIPATGVTTSPARAYDRNSTWQLAAAAVPTTAPAFEDDGRAWTYAVAAGRRALVAEIVGVCQAALDLAVNHTSSREQYGRPLASFQAVRHALAEAHAAIESTRVTLDAVWNSHDAIVWASAVAKVRAGQSQAIVLRHTVQVLGAMGLTLESDMHRHVTRAAALDHVLGGHVQLAALIGQSLLDGADALPIATI